MRKFRAIVTAVASAGMVIGTLGAAAAASQPSYETRAEFVYALDVQLGIQPVNGAPQNFSDVPSSSPYFGYIEAAYQAGITNGFSNGTFGPNMPLTRAEAAKYEVIAYGAGAQAIKITSTNFADNAQIPTALVGYVGEAATLGLLKGFPNGDFMPQQDLTTSQEQHLLAQLKTAIGATSLKVTAAVTDAAVGQEVALSAIGVNASGTSVAVASPVYSVTGTNASSALISGSLFVASQPGNYTVQATSGTATGTVTIGVFGAAAGLKITPPTTLVANGVQKASLTVSVVDANGNVVANSVDAITLTENNASAATIYGNTTVDAVNGVATFTLLAGDVSGVSTTFQALDGTLSTTAAVTSVAQVPTSITVTPASPYIVANGSNGNDVISATIVDQTGNPMVSGIYDVSFSVTGAADFGGTPQAPILTAAGIYYGPSQAKATVTLDDIQGSTGPATITASVTNLTSGTTAVQAVVAGTPAELSISAPQSEQAGTAAIYTVTAEDGHSYPVQWTGSVTLTSSQTGITFSPSTLTFNNDATASFTVTGTQVGNYSITATAVAGGLTSATTSFTVTAGAVAKAAITPINPAAYAQIGSTYTSWTYSVQLEDASGNPVPQSGTEVDFTLQDISGSPTGGATLNGIGYNNTTPPTVKAYTGSNGVATATVSVPSYPNATWDVSASLPLYPSLGTLTGAPIAIQEIATQSLGVTYSPVGQMTSGTTYTGTITLYGPNNIPVITSDVVYITASGSGTVTLPGALAVGASGNEWEVVTGGGFGHFSIQPGKAGVVELTLTDESVVTHPSSVSGLYVVAGTTLGGFGFTSGTNTDITASTPLSVPAGGSVAVTVMAEDGPNGNPIPVPSTVPVDITPSTPTGSFELRSGTSAADLASPYPVAIQAGQTSATFYYVNDTTGTQSVTFGGVEDYKFVVPTTAVSAPTSTQLSWTVTDQSGAPLAGVSVSFKTTNPADSVTATGVTNASGVVYATFSPGTGWANGSTDTVVMTVIGTQPVITSPENVTY